MSWTKGDLLAELSRSKIAKNFGPPCPEWWEVGCVRIIAEVDEHGGVPCTTSPQYWYRYRNRVSVESLVEFLKSDGLPEDANRLLKRVPQSEVDWIASEECMRKREAWRQAGYGEREPT